MLTKECFEIKVLDRVLHADEIEIFHKIRKGLIVATDQIKDHEGHWSNIGDVHPFAELFTEIEQVNEAIQEEAFKLVYTHFQVAPADFSGADERVEVALACAIHPERAPVFTCIVCESLFCEKCPILENGAKICPFCGGRCVLHAGQTSSAEIHQSIGCRYVAEGFTPDPIPFVKERLGWRDFLCAVAFPFRSPTGLITGSILAATFALGLIVTLFRFNWVLIFSPVIIAAGLILQFSILNRVFENFDSGKPDRGFMPHLDGFSVGGEILSPLYSALTVLLRSFGGFALIALIAVAFAWTNFEGDVHEAESEVIAVENRLSRILSRADVNVENRRAAALDRRMRQMESVFGSNHLVESKEFEKLLFSITRMTIWFQIPVSLLLAAGLLVFPAVCIDSASRPGLKRRRLLNGFAEMKRIGFDYVKLFAMIVTMFLLLIASAAASGFLFGAVGMPVAGLMISIVTSTALSFYFWVVLCAILGITRSKQRTD